MFVFGVILSYGHRPSEGAVLNGRSFLEQVTVRPGAGQRQNQDVTLDTVNQQPVREDMTFPVAGPIPGKRVVPCFVGESFTRSEGADNIVQQADLPSPFYRQLVVLFELRGELDDILCLSHFFKSVSSISRSV